MKFFLKHQKIILRSLGALLLLVGFVIHFWFVPQKGVSQNDLAAARVARMEASIHIKGAGSNKKDTSGYSKALKETHKKQMEYLTIFMIIIGIGSLGYSFIPKRDS